MENIVGIDLGTTNCSITAIDENGKRKYKHYYTPDECALLKNYL